MLRNVLPAICAALCAIGISPHAKAVSDFYEPLPEIERPKPYPVERFAERVARVRIEMRPVR